MSLLCTPKISIIILNWNGKRDTLSCLASLQALTYPRFDVICVDNGSTDGSIVVIKERFPHIHCIAIPHNLGFAGGNNIGIDFALKQGADYVMLLNNDTIVAPDLLEHFIEGFKMHPQAGILGARIYLFDKQDTLDHLGGMWIKKKADVHLIGFRKKDSEIFLKECMPIDYVCGACMIIKHSVIETIGLLEPRYFLYWEENDFCLRAQRCGFLIFTCPQAKIWHKVSASIAGRKTLSTYFWWRGRLLWIERNYTHLEKITIYLKIIIPALFKLVKLNILKTLQLGFLHLFYPKEDHSQRLDKLLKLRAALSGIKDYLLRRFDKGPTWISTPINKRK